MLRPNTDPGDTALNGQRVDQMISPAAPVARSRMALAQSRIGGYILGYSWRRLRLRAISTRPDARVDIATDR
jgi:hypothetical protein